MSFLFSTTMLALLMMAAWRDVATRTIPDTISLLLVATGGLARILEGPSALALSAATALLLFVLLLVAYSRGLHRWRRRQDHDRARRRPVAARLLPLRRCHRDRGRPAGDRLPPALAHDASRAAQVKRTSLLGRVSAVEAWRIRRRGPLPYGVAIAAGGAFVLLHSGSF